MSFDNIPEKLIVPFNSIKGFLDPQVQFGLQFEVVPVDEDEGPKEAEVVDMTGKPNRGAGNRCNESPGDQPRQLNRKLFPSMRSAKNKFALAAVVARRTVGPASCRTGRDKRSRQWRKWRVRHRQGRDEAMKLPAKKLFGGRKFQPT